MAFFQEMDESKGEKRGGLKESRVSAPKKIMILFDQSTFNFMMKTRTIPGGSFMLGISNPGHSRCCAA
ncbi:MAG: hypothetical protein EBY24_20330 [Betaproteobacteria bacterium]|nr:hypothetical protein [Betaproteobacteria bacterium]